MSRALHHEFKVWGTDAVARVVFTYETHHRKTYIFDRGAADASIDGAPSFIVDGHVDDGIVTAVVRAWHEGREVGRKLGRRDVAAAVVATIDALRATAADGRPL